ncbi:hypothetical protein AKJ16_DCAP14574 [Drosera capensis]
MPIVLREYLHFTVRKSKLLGQSFADSPPPTPPPLHPYFAVMACHVGWMMPFRIQKHDNPTNLVRHMKTWGLCLKPDFALHATFSRGENLSEFDDGSERSSFWVKKYKHFIRTLKAVLIFLSEQPSQLKYIEWPSFQSTLKTAALTLVLVSVLVVALSSVDAVLAYLLALYLRRSG